MKKIVLSLLALAATMNIMAVTYSAKATITLESADSYESCEIIIGQSSELAEGLNNGEYAEINMEGRSVALYVEYGGVKYQHFASNPKTMRHLTLAAMTDAATSYNLIISDVEGMENFKLQIGDQLFDVVAGTQVITLTPNQTAAIGIINPASEGLCFNYNVLEITGHQGKSLVVKNGTTEIANVASLPAIYALDLSAQPADTRVVVTLNGVDYQIDVNPTVTVVP